MSLKIDEQKVTAVLLADGWHEVVESTFVIDAYEFVDASQVDNKGLPATTFFGGQSPLICTAGFEFTSRRYKDDNNDPYEIEVIAGALTSVLAVKEDKIG